MSEPTYTGFEYVALQHMRAEIEAPLKAHISNLVAELAALRAERDELQKQLNRMIKDKLVRAAIGAMKEAP